MIIPDFPKHLVTIKFILGLPPIPEKSTSKERKARPKLLREVQAEMDQHEDMVMLSVRSVLRDERGERCR